MEIKLNDKEFNVINVIYKFLQNCSTEAKASILGELLSVIEIRAFWEGQDYIGRIGDLSIDKDSLQVNLYDEKEDENQSNV